MSIFFCWILIISINNIFLKGALLFFVLKQLSSLNPTYRFSLEWHLKVFTHALQSSARDSELTTRLENIKSAVLNDFYTNCCIGLFQKHRPLLAFMIAIKLDIDNGSLSQQLYDSLVLVTIYLYQGFVRCCLKGSSGY